ncbi:hypothetical protein [Flavisolibacter ginsengisoli]|jgi:hypothetical protein|uniref:Uncharacterized protein n=1 Tax=Flavisolibacter ginsengisoli DSM 18119 TaxID=1121884 RepID=A0A1M5FJP0_9BACT|nr:hypothetical protein [Flavisolibacter ginsengisoli]SHF91740.1 hypothetical protein SAMN02745131_03854 [Flavisolibacter ginsengisoli DSM 18119]HJW18292.1 hypothetical protein [Flavisolibacter sp.]
MYFITLVTQLLLVAYHQATTLFDLYPFNNVRDYSVKERLTECLINGITMIMPFIGFYFHVAWMMMAAIIIYPALLIAEYFNWWQPYLFGASEPWQKVYDRLFRSTIIVLPAVKKNPVPNLEHLILHGLTLITCIVTYISYFTQP